MAASRRSRAILRPQRPRDTKVVKTVFLENGVFVPYREQVVLTKNGENDDLRSTHKNKGLRSSEPRNRRK